MNLKQVRYFCEVVDSGTLSRAAERLFVAPTAISMQMAQLEDTLGGALFDRSVKPMVLTTLGQFFLPRAREWLALAHQLEQVTKDVAIGKTGWLGIGFVRSLMYSIVPKAVRLFRAQHPDVKLELVELLSEEQPEQLRSGRIHIGLARHTRIEEPPSDFRYQLLFEDPFVAAVPAQHALAQKGKASLKSLSALPLIVFPKNPSSSFAAHVVSMVNAAGIEPRIGNEAIEIHTALGLVAAGMGYSIMGASVADRGPHDVVFLEVPELRATTRVVAVTRIQESAPLVASMLSILENEKPDKIPRL